MTSGGPWTRSDIIALSALVAAGLTGLVAGWTGTSGEPVHASQTAWLDLGIAGLIVTGAGIALWLMRGRRAVGQRRAALLADVDPGAADVHAPAAVATAALVAMTGMSRYHRADCELVAGKRVRRVRAGQTGLTPCGVCEPDVIDAA